MPFTPCQAWLPSVAAAKAVTPGDQLLRRVPHNMAAHTTPFPESSAGFERTCVSLPVPDNGRLLRVPLTHMTGTCSFTRALHASPQTFLPSDPICTAFGTMRCPAAWFPAGARLVTDACIPPGIQLLSLTATGQTCRQVVIQPTCPSGAPRAP